MKMFLAFDSDIELLPHFLAHHRKLGFTHFYASVTGDYVSDYANLRTVQHRPDPDFTYFSSVQRAFRSLVSDFVADGDWYGISELDEFHSYSEDLAAVIEKCEAAGCDVVLGRLTDRVAADGSLPALLPDVPLEEQFPLTSRISDVILDGCNQKVMLCKGRHFISGGNHAVLTPHRAYHQWHIVNHYKWHANVLNRIRNRLLLPTDEGNGWLAGNRRVLNYWERHHSVLIK